jgi:hypothetical protein
MKVLLLCINVINHPSFIVGEKKCIPTKTEDVARPSIHNAVHKEPGDEIFGCGSVRSNSNDTVTSTDSFVGRTVQSN